MWKLISVISLNLLLLGCGFHLRGMSSATSNLGHVSIINQKVHTDVKQLLTELLRGSSVCVDDNPSLSNYWIILEEDALKQNVISISSSTNARQYQLVYTIKFKLENTTKNSKIEPDEQIVTVTRQVTLNSQRILGSSDEQNTLESEMRQEAVQLLFARITSI